MAGLQLFCLRVFALFVASIALVNAASLPVDIPICAKECPVTGSSIFSYRTERTYSYAYTGKSAIHLQDLGDGISAQQWSSQVDFTWITPCDVAITFKNPVAEGSTGLPDAKFLERYPLVMAVTDGRVQHVCVHPDDDTWSVNFKKGVASVFQNSLPSRSGISSGLEFVEVDTVGKCPTKYEVEKTSSDEMKVTKHKNHRHCKHHYPTPSETPAAWLKTPLPLDESKSKCTQKIKGGIYTSIFCEDKNVIRPSYGAYKYVAANQESKLEFKRESSDIPDAISNLGTHLIHKSLLFDHEAPKKDPSVLSHLDDTLKQLCEKTKLTVDEDAASIMAETLRLLRKIPRNSVESLLGKIRSGHFCSDHHRLEALFFDAVGFIHEPEFVDIIVKEIISGRAIGGRRLLYTAALHLTHRPNIQAITALKPLFEVSRPLHSAKLAAGAMVHSYCRLNPHCQGEPPIRQIVETVTNKVIQTCTPSTAEEALANLKALGNMGIMASDTAKALIDCIEKHEVPINVRVAATQAFRNAECDEHATKHLLRIAKDETKQTEIRIASYLAAVRCVNKKELNDFILAITEEENTQARSFILSHLLNLQGTSDPHKERLRYLLTDSVLPVNFTSDFRKYSRNIDHSYYVESLRLGAGYESDLIFAPGSYVPRSVNFNLTSILGDVPFNLGEFGARVEGLEPVLKKLFGPNGISQKFTLSKIVQDFVRIIREKGSELLNSGKIDMRHKRSVDSSTISNFLSKIYGKSHPEKQKADWYARSNGQEFGYGSWSGDLSDININDIKDFIQISMYEWISQLSNMNADTARTGQISLDYSIPTIQGVPLKLQLEGTAVLGFKINSKLHSSGASESPNLIEIHPGLSSEISGFIGFDTHFARNGIRMNSRIASNNGLSVSVNQRFGHELQIQVNLPDKMDLISVTSDIYLMKEIKGHPETKVIPSSVRNVRVQDRYCSSGIQSLLGLQFCYDYNIPNILHSVGLPLGEPSFLKVFLKKTDVSMRGYILTASIHEDEGKVIKFNVEAPGTSPPKSAEAMFKYKTERGKHAVLASVKATGMEGKIGIDLTRQDRYMALETFMKFVSGESQSLGGIKLDMKTQWTATERGIEFNAYSSPTRQYSPESKIVEVQFTEQIEGEQSTVNFTAKTAGNLQRLMNLNIEVAGDLWYRPDSDVPIPLKLRKAELHYDAGTLAVMAYIQKINHNDYFSLLKITHLDKILLQITAEHIIKRNGGDMILINTSAQGHIMGAAYKCKLDIATGEHRKGLHLDIIRNEDHMKIVDIDAFFTSDAVELFNINLAFDLPEYFPAVLFETKLRTEEAGKYLFEAALHFDRQEILRVSGPADVSWYSESSIVSLDLIITTPFSEPLTVFFTLEVSSKKHMLHLVIKNDRETFFTYDWLFTVDSVQKWIIRMHIDVPIMVSCSVEAQIKDKDLSISTNILFLPKSSSPRRIKGAADVNLEDMRVKMEIYWDSDRDPTKKITLDMKITPNPISTDHFICSGTLNYKEQEYSFYLEMTYSDSRPWSRTVNFRIKAPSGHVMSVESALVMTSDEYGEKLEFILDYTNFDGLKYKFTQIIIVTDYYAEGSFKIIGHSEYRAPGTIVTTVDIEAKYIDILSERLFDFKITITTPLLRLKPLEFEFKIDNKIDVYSLYLVANTEVPLKILNYELVYNAYNGIQSLVVDLDLKAAVRLLDAFRSLIQPFPHGIMSHSSSPYKYSVGYEKTGINKHSLVIESPSRRMEGEVEVSPNHYSVKYTPGKEGGGDNYEIAATSTSTGTTGHGHLTEWRGYIKHPSLSRGINLSLQYKTEPGKKKGTIEIDVFQNEDYKIVGTMESQRVTSNTIWVEASLNSKCFTVNPKVSVTAAYATRVISFDMKFRKTPTADVSLLIAGRIDRSHGKEAALALTIHHDRQPVFELSGSVSSEELSQCKGLGIKAIAQVAHSENYHLNVKTCNPGFIEIAVSKQDQENIHIVKFGYEDPKTAEISLSIERKDTLQIIPVMMVKMNLASPKVIDINLAKSDDQIQRIKNAFEEEIKRIASIIPSWLADLFNGSAGSSDFPPSEFQRLIEEVKEDVKLIYNDIVVDIQENPLWERIKPNVYSAFSSFKILAKNISILRNRIAFTVQKDLHRLQDGVLNVIVNILRMIENGETPRVVSWIFNSLERIPEFQELKHFLESLIQKYPEDFEIVKQIIAKIIEKFEEDVDRIRDVITRIPSLQRNLNWMFQNYNKLLGLQMDELISRMIRSLLWISVQSDDHQIKISIPTHRPIFSLVQASQYLIPKPTAIFGDLIWLYYSFEPDFMNNLIWGINAFYPRHIKDVLPPYDRTAMVVEGSEILTFDGVVLRAPKSSCKILLMASGSNFLTMEHPQPEAPQQITLKTSVATVVIKPNYVVTVNGKEMTTEGMEINDLYVWRLAEEIVVQTPVMTTQVDKRSHTVAVTARGWVFGQTAGLLGTYDGEVATDWLMPNGVKASTLQDLVRSWQEDSQCPTPSISPVDPDSVPMIRKVSCHGMLDVHSTCKAVISPEPFVRMCYGVRDVRVAADAYRVMCTEKRISQSPRP